MDVHFVRQQLKSKNIYDVPLRVTFYARVSSEKDEQLNSLDNQISYYKDFIKQNKNWQYVDGYIDEGISGISVKKRENFHNMINDAKNNKFDLIITKEITRFARNTLDSIKYTRDLLSFGVGVFFQNDNINTLDEDSELRLTIMSGIAQDELRKLSSRVKFGHQQAMKNKVVLGNSRIFGYKKLNKKLIIDESEAIMVRELFELYSADKYSLKQIEKIFWNKGYRNLNGNKIAHSTMSNMISNPKYKGYYCGNKVKVIDMFTKKQKFLPKEEWILFKDETGEIVPAIVDEELWNKANKILKQRSKDVKERRGICNHDNLLTGKLICTHCDKPYYRHASINRSGEENSTWICSEKLKNGKDSCPSFPIYESEIKPILLKVFKKMSSSAEQNIERYITLYKSLDDNETIQKEIGVLKNKIDLSNKKKSKLLEYNISGKITDDDFLKMNNQLLKDIENAESQILSLEEQKTSKEEFNKHISKIRSLLANAEKNAKKQIIDKLFIKEYIDKIYVTPEDGQLRLDIKIFTGETTSDYLSSMKSRTGQMFKKSCPVDTIIYTRRMRTLKAHEKKVVYNVYIDF